METQYGHESPLSALSVPVRRFLERVKRCCSYSNQWFCLGRREIGQKWMQEPLTPYCCSMANFERRR